MVAPFLITYIFNWVVYSIIIVSPLRKNFQSNIKSKDSIKITFTLLYIYVPSTYYSCNIIVLVWSEMEYWTVSHSRYSCEKSESLSNYLDGHIIRFEILIMNE